MGVNSLVIHRLEVDDPSWAELTLMGDGRTAFHCPDLARIAAQAYGHSVVGWSAIDDDEMIGGLVVTKPSKGQIAPTPATIFNGPVVKPSRSGHRSSRDRHSSRVLSSLLAGVGSEGGASLRLHPAVGDIRDVLIGGWIARPTFTYEMDLNDVNQVWTSMDGDRRRLVRRAESLGYAVDAFDPSRSPPDSIVGDLIDLHIEQKSRYGNSRSPDPNVWRTLVSGLLEAGPGRLFFVRARDGSPVGFQFVVVWGDRAANIFTGSSPWHADRGSNSLLRWTVASTLSAAGVDRLDLNGAREGSAGRFKASLGASLTERWELYRPDRSLSGVMSRMAHRARNELQAVRRSRRTRSGG